MADRASTSGVKLPYSYESEASVLGAIIIDTNALVKIADKITTDDFYEERHQKIFNAISDLYEARKAIDVLTISNQLKAKGALDEVGGASYITELTNFVPTAAHVESYATIVVEKAVRRRLMAINKEIAGLVMDESKELKELIEIAESELMKVGQKEIRQSVVSIEAILAESFERLDDLHKDKNKIRGVTTGFRDMDNMLAGLQKSDLFIIAGRPSMGKTAFCLSLAHNVATIGKESVLFFSLEMSKEQLVDRMLSMESGVDAWALRTGNLSDADFEKIGHAMGTLSEAPIFFDDSPALTISDLRTKARREAHKNPLGLIIVDYLQLMSGGSKFSSSDNRVQEISEISRGLKGIARELNVPLIALSQLSRSVESRNPPHPQLADLRESGSIEQDADVVAFLYREEYYNPETDRKSIMDIFIKKHRNGPVGNIELFFDKEKQRYRSLDTKHAGSHPFSD
jgi:replicative DNA helicase